jgi:hypothetical protein
MAAGAAVGAAAFLGLAEPSGAQSELELRQRVQTLEGRVAELEGAAPGRVLASPGITLTFGGYVKADFIYDFDESQGDFTFPAALDGEDEGAGDDGGFRAHARQTRLWLRAETDTAYGPATGYIELDFFGGGGNQRFSNSYEPRLRQAYVEWNGWLVGQTWSNFMSLASYPATLDFEGPSGMPFIRQAQIRYTHEFENGWSLSGSIENPEFTGRDVLDGTEETFNSDDLPDVTLAAERAGERSTMKLSGLLRQLSAPGSDEEEQGWGVHASATYDLTAATTLMGNVTYGDGIGRYIIDGVNQDAFLRDDGTLETIEALGVAVAARQDFSETVSGQLAYGYYGVEDTFSGDDDTDSVQSLHATLFWQPTERTILGAELIYQERELADGRTFDNTRLQTSVQFNF